MRLNISSDLQSPEFAMHKLKCILAAFFVLIALTAPSFAVQRKVTLIVPGMNCSACRVTLNKALKKVTGVEQVGIVLEQKLIIVTYDDLKTNVEALIKATTDAGYPSQTRKVQK
jgi:mercuric ion binding protein